MTTERPDRGARALADAFEAFEREMWPLGPAHGSGSGIWAKHKARIEELLPTAKGPLDPERIRERIANYAAELERLRRIETKLRNAHGLACICPFDGSDPGCHLVVSGAWLGSALRPSEGSAQG